MSEEHKTPPRLDEELPHRPWRIIATIVVLLVVVSVVASDPDVWRSFIGLD